MPKPEGLALVKRQIRARETGQKVCTNCGELFDPEGKRVRWCPPCRVELKTQYDAEREVILAQRKLERTKKKVEAEQEAEAELWAAGLVKCSKCRKVKDAFDGYQMCPDCREYYRERKRAAPSKAEKRRDGQTARELRSRHA